MPQTPDESATKVPGNEIDPFVAQQLANLGTALVQLTNEVHDLRDRLEPLGLAMAASNQLLPRTRAPLHNRLRTIASELFEAIGGPRFRLPTDRSVARVDTDVGELLVPAHDTVIVPMLREHGTWEAEEATIAERALTESSGELVIDVGAHIGYLTHRIARSTDATVLAVESEPLNAGLLCLNLLRNGLTHVLPIHAAAGESTGLTQFSLDPTNTGDHRAFARDGFDGGVVACLALDDLIPAETTVGFVKIDAQGMDHAVIRGMRRIVANSRPLMLTEFWPSGIIEFGDSPSSVIREYRELGYQTHLLGLPELDGAPAEDLVAIAEAHRGNHMTLILSP
jgi:FkbM family methyltransferase